MKQTWLEIKRNRHCYLWLMPFFIIFVLFYLYPAISGFFISLTDYDGLGAVSNAAQVGLKNYEKMFRDDKFWLSLKNTFVLWLYIVPVRTFLALIMAALLNSNKLFGKKIYSVVVLLPYVTAVAVVAIIFRILLTTEGGLLNVLLGQQIGWLDTTALSKVSVAIMNIWRMVGYFSLVLLAGMQKIPSSVYEAAAIDGAGTMTRFFRIVIPLMVSRNIFCSNDFNDLDFPECRRCYGADPGRTFKFFYHISLLHVSKCLRIL